MEMNKELYHKILELCKDGNKHMDNLEYTLAIEKYNNALELLPEPKFKWEAAAWIYSALGDSYFALKDYVNAENYYFNVLSIFKDKTNSFFLFRIGQCFFELGDEKQGTEYLLKSYLLDKEKFFIESDEKYYNAIKNRIIS